MSAAPLRPIFTSCGSLRAAVRASLDGYLRCA
jgi:hypothetical protein